MYLILIGTTNVTGELSVRAHLRYKRYWFVLYSQLRAISKELLYDHYYYYALFVLSIFRSFGEQKSVIRKIAVNQSLLFVCLLR